MRTKTSAKASFIKLLILLCTVQWLSAQSVTPDKQEYTKDENISVSYSGGPGNSTDWVAIYPTGTVPSGDPAATKWSYTNGTQKSGGNLTEGKITFTNPALNNGKYSVWFLAKDGYTVIAGPVDIAIVRPKRQRDQMPEEAPSWITKSFKRRHAVTGVKYTGKISAYASSNGYNFSKVSGPDWLEVSPEGELSGTPPEKRKGINLFTVKASNNDKSAEASMMIEVYSPGSESVKSLKVMSYNAWHGWGKINNGNRKGIESIILSGADIIGMQESTDNVTGSNIYQPEKIADELGWYYRSDLNGSLGLISRYPISDESLNAGIARGIKVKVTTSPLKEVILMTCHLNYTQYGPYAAQLDGADEESVLKEENSSQRDEQITAIMAAMKPLLDNADNIPVFLTGDFNAPSHLDWVSATARSHNRIRSVAWPTSTAVINAGMIDSFREIHTKPRNEPGYTWSPVFQGKEPQDRIDFVYYKGTLVQPEKSIVFTTKVEEKVGSWGSSIEPLKNNTWPSDHGSVITTFKLKPAK